MLTFDKKPVEDLSKFRMGKESEGYKTFSFSIEGSVLDEALTSFYSTALDTGTRVSLRRAAIELLSASNSRVAFYEHFEDATIPKKMLDSDVTRIALTLNPIAGKEADALWSEFLTGEPETTPFLVMEVEPEGEVPEGVEVTERPDIIILNFQALMDKLEASGYFAEYEADMKDELVLEEEEDEEED